MPADKQIFIPDSKSRKNLAKRLNLEYNEKMQDWEYEVSDYTRISEFVMEYENQQTTDKERESLMEIILDCLNELIQNNNKIEFEKYIKNIKKKLNENSHLHIGTVNYWHENDFLISTFLKT